MTGTPAGVPGDPFTLLTGAVLGTGPDAAVPAHYGDPLGEQRRLVERGAVLDLSHRAVLTVEDAPSAPRGSRLRLLDAVGTRRVAGLRAGGSAETLVLTPAGIIRHAVQILDDGALAWLIAEAGEAAGLARLLGRPDVVVTDRSSGFGVVGARASVPPVTPRRGAALIWRDPWRYGVEGGASWASGEDEPADGWSWRQQIMPREDLAQAARTAAGAAGALAFEALRVEACRPRFATEVDERATPRELGWTRTAVQPGEPARSGVDAVLADAEHPTRRRLALLYLDGSESVLPRHGAPVWLDAGGERLVIGTVTTGAMHYELGPIALALIEDAVGVRQPLNVDEADTVIPALQAERAGL